MFEQIPGAMIIGAKERAALARLRTLAAAEPMDVRAVLTQLQGGGPAAVERHRDRMTRYSIPVPKQFKVTFSVEIGHPCGVVRHLSVSTARAGRSPSPAATWMLAEELGFQGSLDDCKVWMEPFGDDRVSVNVAQPIILQLDGGNA